MITISLDNKDTIKKPEGLEILSSAHEFLGKSEEIDIPERFTFPYARKMYGENEQEDLKSREILSKFFTNLDGPVYAIKNMDSEVAGALLSMFSRMEGGVREVFLEQFIKRKESGLDHIISYLVNEADIPLEVAKRRTKAFYDKVFGEYGDDSVIQMASVYVCFEGVSQIAAKEIEDGRIASSFIEKSTRYVNFGEKVNEHYLFMESPELMKSEFKDEYIQWNNSLFEAYNNSLKITYEVIKDRYPLEQQKFKDNRTGQDVLYDQLDDDGKKAAEIAYRRATRAKAFDAVRVFLPTTTVTNLGAHLSAQAAESMINKMLSSRHSEVRMLGILAYQELVQVSPNVLSKIDHPHGVTAREYLRQLNENNIEIPEEISEEFNIYDSEGNTGNSSIRLIDYTKDAEVNIATALLFKHEKLQHLSASSIREVLSKVKEREEQEGGEIGYSKKIVEIIKSAIPKRINRRNKLPRAFEHAWVWLAMISDWGDFRDLQRNRMNTILRQYLSAKEAAVPEEFSWEGMEKVQSEYSRLVGLTADFHERLISSGDEKLKAAAEYVTIFGNKVRFTFSSNLRQWAFFSELRTIAGGHPSYRELVQDATKLLFEIMPWMEDFVPNINWSQSSGLGRLSAEVRTQNKRNKVNKKGATK